MPLQHSSSKMHRHGFEEAVRELAQKDPRYDASAYIFLRDALDFTINQVTHRGRGSDSPRHVRGPELLEGFRRLALEQFGPMAHTVLEVWGVTRCEDVGEMAFRLVDAGIFGRSEDDSLVAFRGCYAFHSAFVFPFLPKGNPLRPLLGSYARR